MREPIASRIKAFLAALSFSPPHVLHFTHLFLIFHFKSASHTYTLRSHSRKALPYAQVKYLASTTSFFPGQSHCTPHTHTHTHTHTYYSSSFPIPQPSRHSLILPLFFFSATHTLIHQPTQVKPKPFGFQPSPHTHTHTHTFSILLALLSTEIKF